MKLIHYIKSNPKIILTIIFIIITIYLMLIFEMDLRAITIITLLLGYITNIFTGLIAIISLIPVIGPIIVNILTIPVFWFINLIGYITSAYAVKKGYRKRDLLTHRLITVVLLIGITIGYILGHLIPVR